MFTSVWQLSLNQATCALYIPCTHIQTVCRAGSLIDLEMGTAKALFMNIQQPLMPVVNDIVDQQQYSAKGFVQRRLLGVRMSCTREYYMCAAAIAG